MPCESSCKPKPPCSRPQAKCKLVRICKEEKVRVSEVSCPKRDKVVCTRVKA